MKTDIAQFLTPKQKDFCDEYLIDMNATAAALRAGYSATTALNGALMRLPKIKAYLQERTEQVSRKLQISEDMVLKELAKIAFGSTKNYFDENGKLKPAQDLNDDEHAALSSLQVGKDGTLSIKMHNKLAALDKICRHLNFYKPDVKKPEPRYVYLDKEDMTDDDYLDDDEDDDMLNIGGKNKDMDLPDDTDDDLMPPFDPDAIPVDMDGNILCDGAGIPYGPPRKMNPDHFLDLNQTPAELLAKLKLEKPDAEQPLRIQDDPARNYGFPKIFAVTRK